MKERESCTRIARTRIRNDVIAGGVGGPKSRLEALEKGLLARRWLRCRDGTPTQAPLSPNPSSSVPLPFHPSFTLPPLLCFSLSVQSSLSLFLSHCCSFSHFLSRFSSSLSHLAFHPSFTLQHRPSFSLCVHPSLFPTLSHSFISRCSSTSLHHSLFIPHRLSLPLSRSPSLLPTYPLSLSFRPSSILPLPLSISLFTTNTILITIYALTSSSSSSCSASRHLSNSRNSPFFSSVVPCLRHSPAPSYIFSRPVLYVYILFSDPRPSRSDFSRRARPRSRASVVRSRSRHNGTSGANFCFPFLLSFCTCSPSLLLFFAVVARNRLAFPARRTAA